MALAHFDAVPKEVVAQLTHGDMIFTQRLNSILSWGTMYFASTSVDHVAVYEKDGQIVHFTLSGAKRSRIAALAKGARVLPLRFAAPADFAEEQLGPGADGGFLPRKRRLSHALPPKLQLAWVAVLLMVGFFPERFRWKFIADMWTVAALSDLALWYSTGTFAATPLASFATVFALYRQILYQLGRRKGRPYERLSHPDIGYHAFFKRGGYIFTKIGTLVVAPGLGLLPLKVFEAINANLCLGRKGSDNGAGDQFERLN